MIANIITVVTELGFLNIVGLLAIINSPVIVFMLIHFNKLNTIILKDHHTVSSVTSELSRIGKELQSLSKVIAELSEKIVRHDAAIDLVISERDRRK